MSKHSKHVPFWRKPTLVATAALSAGLVVAGVALIPEPVTPTSLEAYKPTQAAQEPQVKDDKTVEPSHENVAPVAIPAPRANAVELSNLALSPIDIPPTNSVDAVDVSTVSAAQKEYIDTAISYETNRREAKRLANESVQKAAEAAELTTAWEAAVAESERLAGIAEEKRLDLAEWARTIYQQGAPTEDTSMMTLLSGPQNADDMLSMYHYMGSISTSKGNAQEQAKVAQDDAKEASDLATQTKKDADAAAASSVTLATQAQEAEAQSATLSTQADKQASDLTREINVAEISTGTFSPISAGQRVLNTSAIEHWNEYLAELQAAAIVLPSAEEVREPATYLPEGLVPVLGVDGNVLQGIAKHEASGLTVLPEETISHVSDALQTVGTQYGTLNTPAQSCEAMIGPLYENGGDNLSTLWTSGQQQPDLLNMMPGDVVYSADPSSGITQAGIYLGADLVVRASAASGYAEVAKVDANLLGANRPSVPAVEGETLPAPVPSEGALPWKCGGLEGASSASSASGWTLPVASGSYDLGLKFDEASLRLKEGTKSPGIEFVAATGTPVVATAEGLATVILNDPTWGNYITITHPDGLSSSYSNLENVTVTDGASVAAGAVLGTVGQTGSSANPKQPSTLVQISFGEVKVDPQILFFSASANGSGAIVGKVPTADGGTTEVNASGHQNGILPDDVLCSINAGGHRLRCDAARAYIVLAAAYKAHFGTEMSITDSYRTYDSQVSTKALKGGLAATPGTSKHGWGLAVDLSGGIDAFGTPQHEWMRANAEKYGFYHPSWAESTGSKPEAWHWEYVATKDQY